MTTTLGLDMSSKKSGYSLFEGTQLIECGLWQIPIDITDWRERIVWMAKQLSDYIYDHNIEQVYCEDVPLSMANPQTLKVLSALQGAIISVCAIYNIDIKFIGVSQWRSSLGLFTGNRKDMSRDKMKESSVAYANKTFNLDLIYKSKSSKFNQDDIADAINVAYSQIKQPVRIRKSFGRG